MTLYALAATAARCAALWDAGVVDVQLRVKDAPPAAIEAEVAAAAQEALARPHARLWVNDHWEAAAGRAGCFGCHLGQEDLAALAPADAARLAPSRPPASIVRTHGHRRRGARRRGRRSRRRIRALGPRVFRHDVPKRSLRAAASTASRPGAASTPTDTPLVAQSAAWASTPAPARRRPPRRGRRRRRHLGARWGGGRRGCGHVPGWRAVAWETSTVGRVADFRSNQ